MSNKMSKKQAKKLKAINANIRAGIYEDWAERFVKMLDYYANYVEDEIDDDLNVGSASANVMLDNFVLMLDGDANNRFYEALNEINAKRNPGSYVLVKPIKRKVED